MDATNSWYVLYVKSRWEKKVYESLKDISLEPFLPLVKTIRQWSDRKKIILKPLFPSYVFVHINSSLEFEKALSVIGVCTYIRFGKEYARVTEKEINQIKLLIEDKNIIDMETSAELPKIGEVKKITAGPLEGLHCEIIDVNNQRNIVVRLESMRQIIRVKMAIDCLYPFEKVI